MSAAGSERMRQMEARIGRLTTQAGQMAELLQAHETRIRRLEAQVAGSQQVPAWMRDILRAAGAEFGVMPDQMVSYGRSRLIATARAVAMFVARDCTLFSYPQIGRALERDHSTVIHARDTVAARMRADPVFAARVGRVVARFQAMRSPDPVSTQPQEALNHG